MNTNNNFTTKQTAKRLGFSLTYVNYLVMEGKLNPFKYLNRNFFTEEELSRFETQRKQNIGKRKSF